MREIDPYTLEMAYAIIQTRKNNPNANSYSSRLLAEGTPAIAQRFGEQALETVIEAMRRDRTRLAEESADLLYHLMVLWADANLEPQDIYDMLAKRMSEIGAPKAAA